MIDGSGSAQWPTARHRFGHQESLGLFQAAPRPIELPRKLEVVPIALIDVDAVGSLEAVTDRLQLVLQGSHPVHAEVGAAEIPGHR